jgi:hypothetical protein
MSQKIPTKSQLVELVKKYKTNRKIGEALGGVPAYLVSYWLRKKNVSKVAEPKFSRYQIQSIWEETGTDARAGAQLEISKAAFYRWRRLYGITEKPKAIKLHQLDLGIGLSRRESYTKATVTEQVLAGKLRGKELQVGERVEILPDRAVVGVFPDEMAGWRTAERPYPVALFEYFNPLQRPASSLRRPAQAPNNERFFFAVDGVFHQQLFEERIPRPFELVACGGYHRSALGAAGAAVFPAEKEAIAAGEKVGLTVPRVYQIVFFGKLPAGCTVTDLALWLQNQIPTGWDSSGVVEMLGEGVDALSPEQRFNLANMAGELPFQTAIVATQKPLMEHPRLGDWEVGRLEVNLSEIEPQIFRHPGGKSGEALSAHLGRPVERIFIGGCQNGCLEDLELAGRLLEDRAVASGVELSILPASRMVYRKALRKGVLDALMAAGAIIYPPGSYPVSWEGKIFATMDRACLDYIKPENLVAGSFLVGVASALTGQLTDPKMLFR